MDRVINDRHLTNIGDALRETLGEDSQFSPEDMGEAIKYSNEAAFSNGYGSGFEEGEEFGYNTGFADGDELGYQAGMEQGYNSGKTDGIEEGKKATNDEWQNYGARIQYGYAFAANATPISVLDSLKYPISGTLYRTFYNNQSLVEINNPLILSSGDSSDCFSYSQKLKKIADLEVGEAATWTGRTPFFDARALEELNIKGVIAPSISFQHSPLSVASLKKVVSCLKDYNGTTNEYKYTVTFKTSAFNALETEGATAEYNEVACTWAELIDNKKWNLVKA